MRKEARARQELNNILSIAPRYKNMFEFPLTGERKWVIGQGRPWPTRVMEDGTYPYVVLPDGEVRVAELPRAKRGSMHHPELVDGRDIIAAGMLKLEKQRVVYISNESGHYGPDTDSISYALLAFKYWNIPVAVDCVRDNRWQLINGGD